MQKPSRFFRHVFLPAALVFLAVSCTSVPETEEERLNQAPTEYSSPEVQEAFLNQLYFRQMRNVKTISWENVTRLKNKDGKDFENVWNISIRSQPIECYAKQTINGKAQAEIYYRNGKLLYRPQKNAIWRNDKMASSVLELTIALLFDPAEAANKISKDTDKNSFLLKLRPKYTRYQMSSLLPSEEIRLTFSDDGILAHREDICNGKTFRYTDYSDIRKIGGISIATKVFSGTKQAKAVLEIRNIKVNQELGQLCPRELAEK